MLCWGKNLHRRDSSGNQIKPKAPSMQCFIVMRVFKVKHQINCSISRYNNFINKPLTSSHRRPFKPSILFSIGGRLSAHSVLGEFCREPCQRATRGRDIVQDDVYTRKCFSESEGTRFGGPGQKALPSMNEFTLLWIFA